MDPLEDVPEEKRRMAAEISAKYPFSDKPLPDLVFIPTGQEEEFIDFVTKEYKAVVTFKGTCPGGRLAWLESTQTIDWDLIKKKFES